MKILIILSLQYITMTVLELTTTITTMGKEPTTPFQRRNARAKQRVEDMKRLRIDKIDISDRAVANRKYAEAAFILLLDRSTTEYIYLTGSPPFYINQRMSVLNELGRLYKTLLIKAKNPEVIYEVARAVCVEQNKNSKEICALIRAGRVKL